MYAQYLHLQFLTNSLDTRLLASFRISLERKMPCKCACHHNMEYVPDNKKKTLFALRWSRCLERTDSYL